MTMLWVEIVLKTGFFIQGICKERAQSMFSGAISVRISSEDRILAIRAKVFWLAEKIGFEKNRAGVLSAITSQIARQILSQTKSGRIDILSLRSDMKRGVSILGFIEKTERNEIELKQYEKQKIINNTDLEKLTAKQLIDEYKIFPADKRELIMQLTKWV